MTGDSTVFLRRDPATKQWVTVPLADAAEDKLFFWKHSTKYPDYFDGIKIGSGETIYHEDFTVGTSSPAHIEGRVFYDSSDHALSYYVENPDVTHNIGQELWVRVRNNTGSLIANGSVVYVSGSLGNRPTVEPADADTLTTACVLGVATHDLSHNEDGYITVFGLVKELNTSAFTEGDTLWLSSVAGQVTNVEPTGSAYKVRIGTVTRAHVTQGSFLVRLSDPRTESPTYEDITVTGTATIGKLRLSDTVWDDLQIPAGSFTVGGVSNPSLVSYQPGLSGSVFRLFEFAKNNEMFATVQMPHRYKAGGAVNVHVHWTPGARGVTERGNYVGWKIGYSMAQYGATFPVYASLDLSSMVPNDCANDQHIISNGASLTIPAGFKESGIILIRLVRTDTGADDTWAGVGSGNQPMLLSADFHFEIDKLGSDEETP